MALTIRGLNSNIEIPLSADLTALSLSWPDRPRYQAHATSKIVSLPGDCVQRKVLNPCRSSVTSDRTRRRWVCLQTTGARWQRQRPDGFDPG